MKLKNATKNIINFSKYFWSYASEDRDFVRHFYLVRAYLRGQDITKTENPLRTKTNINVGIFCLILNHFQGPRVITESQIKEMALFFTEKGYKTTRTQYRHWMPYLVRSQTISSNDLTSLAKDLLSDLLLSDKEVASWKEIRKLLKKADITWEVKFLLRSLNNFAGKRLLLEGAKSDSLLEILVPEFSIKLKFSLVNGKLTYKGNDRPKFSISQNNQELFVTDKASCYTIEPELGKLNLFKKDL